MTKSITFLIFTATILSVTNAIPAFVPAKSERSNYSHAPIRRSAKNVDAELIARAQAIFHQNVETKSKEVASKYPVEYISNVSDYSMWEEFQDTGKLPQPIRGKTGSTNAGPDNEVINRQVSSSCAPHTTLYIC